MRSKYIHIHKNYNLKVLFFLFFTLNGLNYKIKIITKNNNKYYST